MTPDLFEGDPDPRPLGEMNTTPLIDVLLVLLIMIIVTLPVLPHLTPLGLRAAPGASASDAVRVWVDETGTVFWQGEALPDRASLDAHLAALVAQPHPPPLHFDADGRGAFAPVMAVLAAVQRHGVPSFAVTGTERFLDRGGRRPAPPQEPGAITPGRSPAALRSSSGPRADRDGVP
ncbi:biopolymer transporter ExbD [Pararhodospirillum photometricum]|uniref:Biopolymer transport exbD1 protein, putative n=1 Tax=Pararhodospirillum photometricum DSM 122 TaxID=1150469 RepID=H6SK71_PARPM|nr:biopolymer transporter ExbD [Pararhodospirillum photometricum]CCG08386.1 Biopolymer transport exbD1 protein, putative [Pararhodospirillum photometricum DSM 122]